MSTKLIFLLSPLLLLTACATSTPYQAAEGRGKDGYTETQLTENRYRIVFTGNSRTDAETVQDYALLRAAELTLETGNDWFQLVNRDDDKTVRGGNVVGTDIGFGGQTAVFQRCGLVSCSTAVSSSPRIGGGVTTTAERTSHTSQLEMVVGESPAPDTVETYDARELSATLRRLMNTRT